jgi:hypothetical protein
MTDRESGHRHFVRGLLEYQREAEASGPVAEPVLPADVDLEAELDRCFSTAVLRCPSGPGAGPWVGVV